MELGELCDLIVDCEHKTAPRQETGYPSIRTPNIGRGYFILDGVNRVSEETYRLWTRRAIPKPGDLIMAREAPVGNIAIIPPGLHPCLGQRTLLIRCNKAKAEPSFICYLLNGPQVQATIFGMTNGATVPHLNMKDVRTLPIPEIPPLPTQRKIASILSAYDHLIENNLRRIKILEEMAQNLYREWFIKFRFPGHEHARFVESPLGMIPEGWEVKRLDQIVSFQNRGTCAGEHLSDCVYLPIDCIPRKSLAISETRSWKEAKSSLHLFDEGDILFGAMRPYFHKVVVAPFKGVTRKTCFVFKSILPEYHTFSILTLFQDSTVAFANAHSKGATIPYAVWPQAMDGMPVVVPSIDQANKFEEVVGPMLSRIGIIYFQNVNLRQTRDLLLPKLISGEVDVSELDIVFPEEVT